VTQLYPRAMASLSVASYDSQGYGGGIVTVPQPGGPGPRISLRNRMHRPFSDSDVAGRRRGVNACLLVCLSFTAIFHEFEAVPGHSWG
jgi:hypothetical protein